MLASLDLRIHISNSFSSPLEKTKQNRQKSKFYVNPVAQIDHINPSLPLPEILHLSAVVLTFGLFPLEFLGCLVQPSLLLPHKL